MEVVNQTPFPAIAWPTFDPTDTEYVTIVLRVKFLFDSVDDQGLWTLRFSQDQEALFDTDIFYDEETNHVKYESDFTPYKREGDLIINRPETRVEHGKCGVEVLRYDLQGNSQVLLKHMSMRDLGFVHRSDTSRLQWTGTTDEEWIAYRAPKYPYDFNEKHYNAAHENMQLNGVYFEPGDLFVFHKLFPGPHKQMIMLPGVYPRATVVSGGIEKSLFLECDTVIVDIESLDMRENCIYVSYRNRLAVHHNVERVIVDMQLEKALIEECA